MKNENRVDSEEYVGQRKSEGKGEGNQGERGGEEIEEEFDCVSPVILPA